MGGRVFSQASQSESKRERPVGYTADNLKIAMAAGSSYNYFYKYEWEADRWLFVSLSTRIYIKEEEESISCVIDRFGPCRRLVALEAPR